MIRRSSFCTVRLMGPSGFDISLCCTKQQKSEYALLNQCVNLPTDRPTTLVQWQKFELERPSDTGSFVPSAAYIRLMSVGSE